MVLIGIQAPLTTALVHTFRHRATKDMGQNVAGIAAGNGLGATTAPLKAQYKGVAYDANLVVVRVDISSPIFFKK